MGGEVRRLHELECCLARCGVGEPAAGRHQTLDKSVPRRDLEPGSTIKHGARMVR